MRRTPLTTATPVHGDGSLATRFFDNVTLSKKLYGVSIAAFASKATTPTRVCGIGYPTDHTFHLGSIGKAVNGLVYSQLVAQRVIRPQDTLADYLPLDGTPAGRATLESLLTHTSGLPPTGETRIQGLGLTWRMLTGRDPQPGTLDVLLEHLRRIPAPSGHCGYSNLGGAALGHALAAAAQTTYPHLIEEYVARPLGCPTMRVPRPSEPDGPQDVPGSSILGFRQTPWTGEGYAPCGGIRASAEDMAILLKAVLVTPLPGWDTAFQPLCPADGMFGSQWDASIGAGWFIEDDGLVWHTGYAAGFNSVVLLDRTLGNGVFLSAIDGPQGTDPMPVARSILEALNDK